MNGGGKTKSKISIAIDGDILDWVDEKREGFSRSSYINHILRKQREIVSSNL